MSEPSKSTFSQLAMLLAVMVKAIAAKISRNRARFKIPLLLIAVAIFFGGALFSLSKLPLRIEDLNLVPVLVLALVIAPISIGYSAVNMILMGRAVGVPIDFSAGIKISVFAQIAELLPLPGGALVRTAALMKGGGKGLQSTGIVVAFALLWVACAAIGGGIALSDFGNVGDALLFCGVLAALTVNLWLGWKFGWLIALGASVLRSLGLMLVAVRMVIAFAVLSVVLDWSNALGFAFGVILGSAASILPAGLGIGESISALIAIPLSADPAAAFLAVAISRLIGFAVNLTLAWLFVARRNLQSPNAKD